MNYVESPALQSINQVRSKLQQLTTSLQSLHQKLVSSESLPQWTQCQSSLSVIFSQLASLTETLEKGWGDVVLAVPGETFPIVTQEGLLTTLYRSKLLPESEAWQQEATLHGETIKPMEELTFRDRDDVLNASEWFSAQRQKRQWTGFYTKAESDQAFEIDKDDLEDIRKRRQLELEKSAIAMRAMLKFSRTGR